MTELRKTAGALGSAGAGVGAAATAAAASACCVGPVVAPLVVGLLGAGGAAWAASLKPYSGYLLAASGALLAYAFWTLYQPRTSCEHRADGSARRAATVRRAARMVAWAAAFLWTGAVVVNLAVA